jgi:hypothetical protein
MTPTGLNLAIEASILLKAYAKQIGAEFIGDVTLSIDENGVKQLCKFNGQNDNIMIGVPNNDATRN